jgi:lipoprotein-anchoring transpeptidase ErfK/SrfK
MIRMSGSRSSVAIGTLLRVAVLAGAGTMGMVSRANAALYYWPGYQSGFYQQYQPMQPPRRHKARTVPAKKDTVAPAKEPAGNPQAPLIIAVSVGKQRVKIYDANGVYAEAPVSTGMSGHPTPMGVFSVIQKHKYHHSNIYSGAPMPYMQRITWSGVAMHAGVLPGYPASHGCIRMPTAFAVKMWNWTKMGVRVFVTPGEIAAPASFSHPLLPAFKVAPQPAAVELPPADSPAEAKAGGGASSDANVELELRSTVGHSRGTAAPEAATPNDQTRTADAGGASKGKSAVTMSDAPADHADSEGKHVASDGNDARAEAPRVDEASKADQPKAGPQPDAKGLDAPKAIEPNKPAAIADDKTKAGSDTTTQPADPRKDQKRATERPAAAKPEPPKRTGQIAVFISRKDSKLYVRQNFAPLFEAAVTIAPSDRPLGTHVFTAAVDKNDTNVLHWSVVSLPASTRALRGEQYEHVSWRRQKGAPALSVEARPMPVPDDPAEALDRITAPQDAMARIAEALATGGSIIVSDQGINQGETGEGTDFIVSMR